MHLVEVRASTGATVGGTRNITLAVVRSCTRITDGLLVTIATTAQRRGCERIPVVTTGTPKTQESRN